MTYVYEWYEYLDNAFFMTADSLNSGRYIGLLVSSVEQLYGYIATER